MSRHMTCAEDPTAMIALLRSIPCRAASPTASAVMRLGFMKRISRITALRLAVLISFLAIWEGAVRIGFANPFWISSPGKIAERAGELVLDGALFYHTGVTLLEAFAGLAAGMGWGVRGHGR